MSDRRVIGCDGRLPWHLSSDLRRFKRLTMGHPILMGRKTHESIGRPLPGRRTIVITRRADYEVPGGLVAHDLAEAVQLAGPDTEPMVVGGGQIFRQAMPLAHRLYVTWVHAPVDGDTWFPEIPPDQWAMCQREDRFADQRNDHNFSFCVYRRIGPR